MSSSFLTSTSSSFSVLNLANTPNNKTPPPPPSLKITNSSNSNNPNNTPLIQTLKSFAKTLVLVAATTTITSKFPAKAQSPPPPPPSAAATVSEEETVEEGVESLKLLLQQKLENGQDEESLSILERLVIAQPEVTDWKFLMARLLAEVGNIQEARNVFEEILERNPLSFEALFENALLMDRCGEGEAVVRRLQEALDLAQEENKVKEARDVRLIMAQIQFLQKNVEEALNSYQELEKEDPNDFRPYFCKGMIYSLLDRNAEAKEQFSKYRQLSPKNFEVEGYLRTPLSRMKIFGTNEDNN